jgi:hypothetical protein
MFYISNILSFQTLIQKRLFLFKSAYVNKNGYKYIRLNTIPRDLHYFPTVLRGTLLISSTCCRPCSATAQTVVTLSEGFKRPPQSFILMRFIFCQLCPRVGRNNKHHISQTSSSGITHSHILLLTLTF